MFDGLKDDESVWCNTVEAQSSASANVVTRDWRAIHRELCVVAKQRGVLDGQEARLLRAAVSGKIWRELGHATLLEYLEVTLGYGPHAANERVRVALELEAMPELAEALEAGELSYSALRELTRVATPATHASWRSFAVGKNVRQIEQHVSGRKKGDLPSDPADPNLKRRSFQFRDVRPATAALVREAQRAMANERGHFIEDDELLAAFARMYLESARSEATSAEATGGSEVETSSTVDTGRAKFQIMITMCEGCRQAEQQAGGRMFAIEDADRARAECDAQRIGADERATQDIAPKTRRFVMRRDRGACTVPGCRAARNLDIHHIVPREAGGNHDAENLTVLCDGHHHALHDGKLTITGKAPELRVSWSRHTTDTTDDPITDGRLRRQSAAPHVVPARGVRSERMQESERSVATADSNVAPSHVGPAVPEAQQGFEAERDRTAPGSRYAVIAMTTEATQALVQLRFPKAVAREAVALALDHLGPDATLERLCFEAIRRCGRGA